MKAIHSLERNERFHIVRNFVGLDVVILADGLRRRQAAKEYRGRLLSVATSNIGSGTELAVLRPLDGGWDEALSLATIFSVEELELEESGS